MDLLLDTHAFIWFVDDNDMLPHRLDAYLNDEHSNLYISMATFWEMGIKISSGKLELKQSIEQMYAIAAQRIILPINFEVIRQIMRLPFHHRDPFDRMIIAQAINRNLAIISKDAAFDAYGVKRLW